jgi:hypothetical protein
VEEEEASPKLKMEGMVWWLLIGGWAIEVDSK